MTSLRSSFFVVAALAGSLPLTAGCGGFPFGATDDTCSGASALEGSELEPEPGGIHGFASEEELEAYLADLEARQPKPSSGGGSGAADPCAAANPGGGQDAGAAMGDPSSGAAPPSSPGADSNEEITNNQEAGVDEGGIVKNVGSNLVVLRKGRLYLVDIAPGTAPSLIDSMRVARTEALNHSVWYDEMLVKGDLIYVVGYRYGVSAPGEQVRGATEIDTFRVSEGKLSRIKSMYLESNDYYSGHNYASRMVDGKLVFYMPHYIGRNEKGRVVYPRVLEGADDGTFKPVGPIFDARGVMTSLHKHVYPTFHTVVECELPETGELACKGRSVIGSWWRETYVSPDAVYLWASSHVYRFDFAGLDVTAHGAKGHPVDQFSFKQGESELYVAVNGPSSGASLLKLPLGAFDKKGGKDPSSVPLSTGFISKNRFVGEVLVAAASGATGLQLVTFDPAADKVTRASAPGMVQRIEPLGDRRALIALPGDGGLELRALSVDAPGAPLGQVALQGVREGEGRSHGFFYKPGAEGAGTFGYAVIDAPEYGAPYGWGNGISNIGFFDVAPSGALATLGIVSSGDTPQECETSCVDWYGNTRPVFVQDRVFSLMGSELVEVALRPGANKIGAPVVLASSDLSP
jgi:hypothetical protein